jgi:hypothetical protein
MTEQGKPISEKISETVAGAQQKVAETLEAAKAKATVIWLVESWDCEGRSSRPLAFFPTEAEAAQVASHTGPMGTKSEPREKLMFATAADYEAYSRAQYAMESAGRAAYDATR